MGESKTKARFLACNLRQMPAKPSYVPGSKPCSIVLLAAQTAEALQFGNLIFDQAGNIYGTTFYGGSDGYGGVVFKLARSGSGWTESVLWNFTGGDDGANPISGVTLDNAGNLYGTTIDGGGRSQGTAYELSPTQSGWSETTLYSFGGSQQEPGSGGLIWMRTATSMGSRAEKAEASALHTGLRRRTAAGSSPHCTTLEIRIADPLLRQRSTRKATFTVRWRPAEIPASARFSSSRRREINGSTACSISSMAATADAILSERSPLTPTGNMYGTTEMGGTDNTGTVWEITP